LYILSNKTALLVIKMHYSRARARACVCVCVCVFYANMI